MDLTNSLRKTIASLDKTKYRKKFNLFKCEGSKCVLDTIDAFHLHVLVCSSEWIAEHPEVCSKVADKLCIVPTKEISRMSSLITQTDVIAVYHIPTYAFEWDELAEGLTLILDGIQDPGNLGTIIRTADWFGIHNIICSPITADAYSPKVVQATMGAISRVRIHYMPLTDLLSRFAADIPVYGTFLDGQSLYTATLSDRGLIVMGNEGNGISADVAQYIDHRLTIPSFPVGSPTSESLNVAIATSITISEFRRRNLNV